MIDPYRPKLVPYLRNKQKCFWAFTSTSPLQSKAFDFLGDNGYHQEKKIKTGTFFSLYGKVWGYDISLFNSYNETEILLEPERKFRIENVISDANDIKVVTCEIIDSPIVLNDLKNKIVYKQLIMIKKFPLNQSQSKLQELDIENKNEYNYLFDILYSIIFQIERYIKTYRYGHIKQDKKLELFDSLTNALKVFKDKYFAFIKKYGDIEFPEQFQRKKEIKKMLYNFSHCIKEQEIQRIISNILGIIDNNK